MEEKAFQNFKSTRWEAPQKYWSDVWRVGQREGEREGERKNKRREEAMQIKNCKNFQSTPK